MTGSARILVAGAGPADLALALQAHDHGADVRVIDRRPEAYRPSRGLIMHARTLQVLRPLAVTRRCQPVQSCNGLEHA
jgi:2-polyprenyl-6-methoxyphenol hydroxylase-like FAD-dependent oxidoreductase